MKEFQKVMERLGIQFASVADLQALFDHYDTDQSGEVSYKEFSAIVTGRVSHGAGGNAKNVDQLVDNLRQKLKLRGANGMIGLGRNFRI